MYANYRHTLIFTGLLIIAFLGSSGCREKPPLKLTTRQWAKVDTMFNEQLPVLRTRLDSICDASYDERVERAVDSILEVRRREEAVLRTRIPRK